MASVEELVIRHLLYGTEIFFCEEYPELLSTVVHTLSLVAWHDND